MERKSIFQFLGGTDFQTSEIVKAMQAYADQERRIAVEKSLDDLRIELVNKMPPFSMHDKTNTKKHSEWVGFGNAITVLDNFKLDELSKTR